MAPECKVPTADGGVTGMCWLCAHIVADHGVSPEHVLDWMDRGACGCTREAIYPADVIARFNRGAEDGAIINAARAKFEAMRQETRGAASPVRAESRASPGTHRRERRVGRG